MDELQHGWTAVIVNYNGAGYIEACLLALERSIVPPRDVIVVDNASSDDSLMELNGFPRVNVIAEPVNRGFAGGANVGLAAVETTCALLLNPDVEVEADLGQRLVEAFSRDQRLGAIGPLLLYPDTGLVQHAGGVVEWPLMTTRHLLYREAVPDTLTECDVDFVTGGAMGLRTEAVRAIGGVNEHYSPVYYEDVDLCFRLRDAGWRVRFDPSLRAQHHEGVTLEHSTNYYRHLHRNRLRFALDHLSPDEWRQQFVPAEMVRMTHELATLSDDAIERSGAGAIELLLRGLDGTSAWETQSTLPDAPFSRMIDPLEDLRSRQHVALPSGSGGLIGKVWDKAQRQVISSLNRALNDQRAFNSAVVVAFEQQDRINREQTAAVLLLALDLLGRLRSDGLERDAQRAE
ncbi:MAG: glycosyltransferase family 2 protein [Chloroflexota bacterium]|nr:glycosyltransferase family 2 protein [Chloroflexota bacterium]